MTQKRIVALVAGVVVAALTVTAVLFGWTYYTDRQTETARTEAVDAAREQVLAMFGYSHTTVDASLTAAADGLTPDFASEYRKLIADTIIPGAKEKQVTTRVDVRAAAVVSAAPHDATVLIFLNQLTTGKDNPQAAISGSRVRLTLTKKDGRWLTSAVTPI